MTQDIMGKNNFVSMTLCKMPILDRKQPSNPYLHYVEQLENAGEKKHLYFFTCCVSQTKLMDIANVCKSTNYLFFRRACVATL